MIILRIIVEEYHHHTTWHKDELFMVKNTGSKIYKIDGIYHYPVYYLNNHSAVSDSYIYATQSDFNKIVKRVCKNEARLFRRLLVDRIFNDKAAEMEVFDV